MRIRLRVSVILLLTLPLSAAPLPKELLAKIPDYYPILPGMAWEYDSDGKSAHTVSVQDYEKKGDTRSCTLVTTADVKELSRTSVKVDPTGVYYTSLNDTPQETPIHTLKFGIKDETVWVTSFELAGKKAEWKFKLVGVEEVAVPAGKFKAVKVIGTFKVGDTETRTAYYYAEGVGLVKMSFGEPGTEIEITLRKFTPGQADKK